MRPSTFTPRPSTSWLVLAVIALAVLACTTTAEVPDLERRAQQINKSVMCPVCPGESIDQSQHPLAVQMRAAVDEKLDEGWSDDQILDYLEARFEGIRLDPRFSGTTVLLWLLPAGVAVAGAWLAARRLIRQPEPADG